MTKHCPRPVTENTLRLQQKVGTNYDSVTLASAIAIAQLSFKQHRKSLIIKNSEKESCQQKRFPQKDMPVGLGEKFGSSQKSCQSWKS